MSTDRHAFTPSLSVPQWCESCGYGVSYAKHRPKVVTICGSMRFFDQMLTVAAQETAKGHIVLAPFCVVAPEDQGDEHKAMLDRLHFQKIDMSDEVIVVTNQHGYVGDSTRREMAYAIGAGKFLGLDSTREFNIPEEANRA